MSAAIWKISSSFIIRLVRESVLLHAPRPAKSYHSAERRPVIWANLLVQPGTRIGPFTLGSGHRDAEHLRGFLEGEADKIAQLDDFGLAGVVSGEPVERFVDGERLLLVARRCGDLQFRHIDMFRAAAALLAMFPARALDEDSPHGFGSRGEEMRSIGKDSIAQAKPGLVHQRGRLKRMSRLFPRHL